MAKKKFTRAITVQVPVSVVYTYIKNADKNVKPLIQDLIPDNAILSTLEDIPNQKLVTSARYFGTESIIYTELRPIGDATEIVITIEPTRLMSKTLGSLGLVTAIGECKALESGYLAGKGN